MKVRDIITEMNKDVFSSFDHHLMVKLTPGSFSKDVFQKRADDLISYLESENPPAHVTFLLDGYGYIRDVQHYTFTRYFPEFLKACEENANSVGLSDWRQLFFDSKRSIEHKNQTSQKCEPGFDLKYTGKPFTTNKRNNISLSVHVSRNIQPTQRANFHREQKWRKKFMEENQFHLLEEIVKQVSGNDDDTKIQFLEENPELLFWTFRWRDQYDKRQEQGLRLKFERQFNVRSQLDKLRRESDTELSNFLLTQLLNKQKTDKRISCMTKWDAYELWKFTLEKIVQEDSIEPLTLDLVESILMIDIQTGAPWGEEV